jgi:hypothetical protein
MLEQQRFMICLFYQVFCVARLLIGCGLFGGWQVRDGLGFWLGHASARLHFAVQCFLLRFIDSCGEKNSLYMDSQAQECPFNIDACSSCDEKPHTPHQNSQ